MYFTTLSVRPGARSGLTAVPFGLCWEITHLKFGNRSNEINEHAAAEVKLRLDNRMDEKLRHSWERFLNPETLRSNLIVSAIFLSAYEILRQSIIERIRDFYTTGFDSSGMIVDVKYETEVLTKNRSPVYASLVWR